LLGTQSENDFWRFSLRIYRAPGVADECIAVQERYGVDVNLMLFCAWLAAERRIAITPGDLAACRAAVHDWHERTVKPLRAARQSMKGLAGVEPLRTQVKALELEAERIEQTSLFEFAGRKWPQARDANPDAALRSNLDIFLRAHDAPGVDIVPALMAAVEKDASRRERSD
jgi:uncharacterized protein (TIGR02444 family)